MASDEDDNPHLVCTNPVHCLSGNRMVAADEQKEISFADEPIDSLGDAGALATICLSPRSSCRTGTNSSATTNRAKPLKTSRIAPVRGLLSGNPLRTINQGP